MPEDNKPVEPVVPVEPVKEITPEQKQEVKEIVSLSNKDIKWREKYKLSISELEQTKLAQEAEKKQLLEEVTTKEQKAKMYEQKLLDAKLEAQAIAAGIQDLDLIKLIDKSKMAVNEDGTVSGLSEAISEFKTNKPHFFGTEKKLSSSTNAAVPTQEAVQKKSAFDLTSEEWKAFQGDIRAGVKALR